MTQTNDTRLEKLEAGAQDRELRLRLVEATLKDIKVSMSEVNVNIKALAVSMESKYATNSQVVRLEQEMNSRFDDLEKELQLRTSNKLGQTIITVMITAVITALVSVAVYQITK